MRVGRVADSLPPSKRGSGYCVEEVAVGGETVLVGGDAVGIRVNESGGLHEEERRRRKEETL